MQENKEPNRVVLEGRKRLFLTGVESVDAFSDEQVKLSINGEKMLITGDNIKITSFNKGTGNLSAEGNFVLFRYDYKKQSIVKRIFK